MKQVHEGSRGTSTAFFLNDEPLPDLRERDSFAHAQYSRALFEILERTHTRTSYAIGLFGELGVGKTTILNELGRLLSESSSHALRHSYTPVKLDAWRYSEANFRREFLLDLAQRFNCRQKIRDLIAKRVSTSRHEYRAPSRKSIFRGAIMVAIIIGASALLAHFQANSETRFVITMTGILLAGLIAVAGSLGEIFKPVTVVEEAAPPVHPDEFGEIFQKVLEEAPISKENHRLIIAIDNLDRVPGEVVMQVLGAVKSFLNQPHCVYILPCDERGLRQHIIAAKSNPEFTEWLSEARATEYLRKFFQVTLTVRHLLREDLDAFVDDTLAQLPFLSDVSPLDGLADLNHEKPTIRQRNRNEVALVFRVAVSDNPRQVLHLANRLAASYLLASERAKESDTIREHVLENVGLLAKLIVIEERWPAFHELVISEPDTLRHLRTYFRIDEESLLPRTLAGILTGNRGQSRTDELVRREWDSAGLKEFLSRTSEVHSDYVSDFVLLKARPALSEIANYHAFRDAALGNNSAFVLKVVEDEATNAVIAIAELLRELDYYCYRMDVPACGSLVSALLHIGASETINLDSEEKLRIARSVLGVLNKKPFSELVLQVDMAELLALLEQTKDQVETDVAVTYLAESINLEESPDESQMILSSLMQHPSLLRAQHHQLIRTKLDPAVADEKHVTTIKSIATNALNTWEESPYQVFPRSLWVRSISRLSEPGQEADNELVFMEEFIPDFDEDLLVSLCEAAYTKLGQPGPSPSTNLALAILSTIPVTILPEKAKSHFLRGLTGSYPTAANTNEQEKFINTFLKMLPALEGEDQKPFQPRLIDYITKSNIEGIKRLMTKLSQVHHHLDGLGETGAAIAGRVGAFLRDEDLRGAFYGFASDVQQPELVAKLVLDAWEKLEVAWGEKGLGRTFLAEAEKHLDREAFRSLVEQLLSVSAKLPAAHREEALAALGSFPDEYMIQFLNLLVDRLLNLWIPSEEKENRRAGIALWRGIREKATRERGRFHERVLELVRQAINANSTDQPHERILVECIREDGSEGFLEPEHRAEFVSLVLRMVEDGKPQEVRTYGHGVLRALVSWDEAREHVPDKILTQLGNQYDDLNTGNNLLTLQAYHATLSSSRRKRFEKLLEENAERPAIAQFVRDRDADSKT